MFWGGSLINDEFQQGDVTEEVDYSDSPGADSESGSVFTPTAEEVEMEDDESVLIKEEAEDLEDMINISTELETTNFSWNEYSNEFSTGLEGLPQPWPTYEIVNLDRRLPVKFKRHEYEPIPYPTLANLSSSFEDSSIILDYSHSRKEDFNWSESEKDIFFPCILHYGPNSKEMYTHIRDIIAKQYLEKGEPITLVDLRKSSPDTPLLFLVALQQLMTNLKDINYLSSQRKNSENLLYSHQNYFHDGNYICFICASECTLSRYEAIQSIFIVCVDCFECGKYPSSMSSDSFQYHIKYITDSKNSESGIPSFEWKNENLLNLLDGVQKYDFNWGEISNLVGIPENECLYKFVSLMNCPSFNLKTESSSDKLRHLIGLPPNPVISTVNIISNCVHPGLGAEAARACLSFLCNSQMKTFNSDLMWSSAVEGFEAAIQKAKHIISVEDSIIEELKNDIVELQTVYLQKKLQVWQDLQSKFFQ